MVRLEELPQILNAIPNIFETLYKKPIRVAILSYYYEKPSTSGVATHVRYLSESLSKVGCDVHIFCHGKKNKVYKAGKVVMHAVEGIPTAIRDVGSQRKLDYALFEYKIIPEVIREHLKRGFDIVHSHGWLTKTAFLLKEIYGIKWVHTFHAIEKKRNRKLTKDEQRFQNMVEWIESNVNYCDAAIFVSKDLMKEGLKEYKFKKNFVIPNGVDTEVFPYEPIHKRNVLFIGRFSQEKGIRFVLQLIPDVMAVDGSSMTIVSPQSSPPKDLVKTKQKLLRYQEVFKNRIEFIQDMQSHEKLREYYKNCQVYIQPSEYESFGLCIVEAMATGRPVIAFDVGGIPEVVGDAGIVVKTKGEFVKKLKELLENKQKARDIGKRARVRAEKFNWRLIAEKTVKVYNEIL